jgi:hypothetical protein
VDLVGDEAPLLSSGAHHPQESGGGQEAKEGAHEDGVEAEHSPGRAE